MPASMKTYTVKELQHMDFADLCFTADEYGIYFPDYTKNELIDLIIKYQNNISIPGTNE